MFFLDPTAFKSNNEAAVGSSWVVASQICFILALTIPWLIICAGCQFKKRFAGADRPRYSYVLKLFWNIGDFYSDVIFAMVLLISNHYLFIYGMFFTLTPHIISNMICLYCMFSWREHDVYYITKYINKYDWFLIVISVFAGFYSAVEIAQSRLFYFPIFGLQIRYNEYAKQKSWRFFNNVLFEFSFCFHCFVGTFVGYLLHALVGCVFSVLCLEYFHIGRNAPQLVIQIIYAADTGLDFIVFSTMLFSTLSLVIGILQQLSRWSRMKQYKSESNVNYFLQIHIECTHLKSYHQYTHYVLGASLAHTLSIEKHATEVYYIYRTHDGIVAFAEVKDYGVNNMKLMEDIKHLCVASAEQASDKTNMAAEGSNVVVDKSQFDGGDGAKLLDILKKQICTSLHLKTDSMSEITIAIELNNRAFEGKVASRNQSVASALEATATQINAANTNTNTNATQMTNVTGAPNTTNVNAYTNGGVSLNPIGTSPGGGFFSPTIGQGNQWNVPPAVQQPMPGPTVINRVASMSSSPGTSPYGSPSGSLPGSKPGSPTGQVKRVASVVTVVASDDDDDGNNGQENDDESASSSSL